MSENRNTFNLEPEDKPKFYQTVKDVMTDEMIPDYFESLLSKTGFLTLLDKHKVLPNFTDQSQKIANRSEALKYMYVGKILGGFSAQHFLSDELKDKFIGYLAEENGNPRLVYFEMPLEKSGILGELEEMGIIPKAENPPPDFEDIDLLDEWFKTHPEEGNKFISEIELRDEIFQYLYIGTMIGSVDEIRNADAKEF